MKDKLNNKVAVSPSVPSNCSADADKENAKRKTPTKRQHRIENIRIEQELPNDGYLRLTIAQIEIEFEQE